MLDYLISKPEGGEVCKITLSGHVEVAATTAMLTSVWQDDDYKYAKYVIWDLEACDAFPDFNEFVLIVNHARKNKPATGPSRIAFCAPTFENSMLVNIFQGFTGALPRPARFFSNETLALEWFANNEVDAA